MLDRGNSSVLGRQAPLGASRPTARAAILLAIFAVVQIFFVVVLLGTFVKFPRSPGIGNAAYCAEFADRTDRSPWLDRDLCHARLQRRRGTYADPT